MFAWMHGCMTLHTISLNLYEVLMCVSENGIMRSGVSQNGITKIFK